MFIHLLPLHVLLITRPVHLELPQAKQVNSFRPSFVFIFHSPSFTFSIGCFSFFQRTLFHPLSRFFLFDFIITCGCVCVCVRLLIDTVCWHDIWILFWQKFGADTGFTCTPFRFTLTQSIYGFISFFLNQNNYSIYWIDRLFTLLWLL